MSSENKRTPDMQFVLIESVVASWLKAGFGNKIVADTKDTLAGGIFPVDDTAMKRCMIFFDGTVIVIEPDPNQLEAYFDLLDNPRGYLASDGIQEANWQRNGKYDRIKLIGASPFARTPEQEQLIVDSVTAAKQMIIDKKMPETQRERTTRIAQRGFTTIITNR